MKQFVPILVVLITAAFSMSLRADDSVIHSIAVGPIYPVDGSQGDTWDLAWTQDGSVYSPSDDSSGFHGAASGNILFNQIIGDDPTKLGGKTVNPMADYGHASQKGPDGWTWKSSGCIELDGVLYWLVARHNYGEHSDDYDKRQPARNSSFIKSTDGGKTWTRSAQENYDHPMFPGSRFATPYFVQYGQDGHETNADGSDKYVYALSNNGYWDNGDYLILGRVLRSKMPDLKADEWQFYTEGDGAADSSWTSNIRDAKAVPTHPDRFSMTHIREAKAVLCRPDRLGMTRAVYLPKQQCYLMIGWYYPAGGGKLQDSDTHNGPAHVTTNWDFYVASHPWGPWRIVGSHTWTPQGFYSPGICPKFTSADGSTVYAFTAGDWTNSAVYKLNAVELSIK